MGGVENPSFARSFFGRRLPSHIAQHVEKFASLQGSIAFYVRGQGKWTLRLGNLEAPVEDGLAPDADLTLWFSGDAFEAFARGTLDVADAVTREQVAFEGDPGLLERFGFLLAPPTSALGTRFNR